MHTPVDLNLIIDAMQSWGPYWLRRKVIQTSHSPAWINCISKFDTYYQLSIISPRAQLNWILQNSNYGYLLTYSRVFKKKRLKEEWRESFAKTCWCLCKSVRLSLFLLTCYNGRNSHGIDMSTQATWLKSVHFTGKLLTLKKKKFKTV